MGFSLACLATGRELRLIYSNLCDIDSGNVVSHARMSTINAGERLLRLSILLVNTTTFRTGSGGVAGINGHKRNAIHQCFVSHKLSKLTKRPIMQLVSLTFSGRNPFPYTLEVFKGNSGLGAFGFGNKLFGDVMVHPSLKSMLPSRKLSQSFSGSFGPFLLENSSSLLVPKSVFFNGFTRKDFSIGIGRNVDDAKIHTKNFFKKLRFLFGDVTNNRDVPLLSDKQEIDLSLSERKQCPLSISTDKRNPDSTGKSPDANGIISLETKYPIIIGLGRPFPENMDRDPFLLST